MKRMRDFMTAEEIVAEWEAKVRPMDFSEALEIQKKIVAPALMEVPDETLARIDNIPEERVLEFYEQECLPLMSEATKQKLRSINKVVLDATVEATLRSVRYMVEKPK